jgi:hypothetical protein
MKKIAALVAATICMLAFASTASGGQRWGWTHLTDDSWRDAWTSLQPSGALATFHHTANPVTPVAVIPVPVDPVSARAPGALAAVLPVIDNALQSLRHAVAGDRRLAGALAARGYDADEVVGASRLADGTIAVLVGKAA